jgi:hypothetical protein
MACKVWVINKMITTDSIMSLKAWSCQTKTIPVKMHFWAMKLSFHQWRPHELMEFLTKKGKQDGADDVRTIMWVNKAGQYTWCWHQMMWSHRSSSEWIYIGHLLLCTESILFQSKCFGRKSCKKMWTMEDCWLQNTLPWYTTGNYTTSKGTKPSPLLDMKNKSSLIW